MRHFQKEPNDTLSFFLFVCVFFLSWKGELAVGGGGVGGIKHYFSLITSSDVKTVKVNKKIISSSEYIFLF